MKTNYIICRLFPYMPWICTNNFLRSFLLLWVNYLCSKLSLTPSFVQEIPFLSSTRRHWSDNSPFSPCIIIFLPCYWNTSFSIKCVLISLSYNHHQTIFSWPHYFFQLLPYFFLSFSLRQNSFWKLSALAVFNVSSLFLPRTHSNQALESTPCSETLFLLVISTAKIWSSSLGSFPICLLGSIWRSCLFSSLPPLPAHHAHLGFLLYLRLLSLDLFCYFLLISSMSLPLATVSRSLLLVPSHLINV